VALLLVGSPKPDRPRDVFCDGTSKYAKWTTRETGVDSQQGHRFFYCTIKLIPGVGPTQPLIHWDRDRGLKLADHLQLLPRMCGPIHPLLYIYVA